VSTAEAFSVRAVPALIKLHALEGFIFCYHLWSAGQKGFGRGVFHARVGGVARVLHLFRKKATADSFLKAWGILKERQ